MITAFDAATALQDGVNSPQDAWRFITAFSEQWTPALTDHDRFALEKINTAEARHGITLPTVLREAYLIFGRLALGPWLDPFPTPEHLHFEDAPNGKILIFRTENQGCWAWGITEHDLLQDDPPVLLSSDSASKQGWMPLLDRTSTGLVEAVLSEQGVRQSYDGRNLFRRRTLSPALLATLTATHQRINLPETPWNRDPVGSLIHWHAGPGYIIEILTTSDDGTQASLFAQTEEHLQQALATLPGPWTAPPVPKEHQEPPVLPPGIDDPWAVPGGYF